MRAYACFFSLTFAAACLAQTPAPAIPGNISIQRNIPYGQYKETVLDILQPKEASRQKRPGVIVIHGGGWIEGRKENLTASYCVRYVEKGFVCANVEYRLAKVATAPAAVTDVLQATQWFFQNAKKYNVDKKRIVVTGDSAGGHLALMVGMTPKSAKLGPTAHVRAVVNFFGITDVTDLLEGPDMRSWAVAWLPEQPDRVELARRVSPMTYARKDLPAILTFHGDADPIVPYQQAVFLTKAIRDAGGDAEMISVPGGKHGFPKEVMDRLYEKNIWPFLRRRGVIR